MKKHTFENHSVIIDTKILRLYPYAKIKNSKERWLYRVVEYINERHKLDLEIKDFKFEKNFKGYSWFLMTNKEAFNKLNSTQ